MCDTYVCVIYVCIYYGYIECVTVYDNVDIRIRSH